jgi:hypothetical protein
MPIVLSLCPLMTSCSPFGSDVFVGYQRPSDIAGTGCQTSVNGL